MHRWSIEYHIERVHIDLDIPTLYYIVVNYHTIIADH